MVTRLSTCVFFLWLFWCWKDVSAAAAAQPEEPKNPILKFFQMHHQQRQRQQQQQQQRNSHIDAATQATTTTNPTLLDCMERNHILELQLVQSQSVYHDLLLQYSNQLQMILHPPNHTTTTTFTDDDFCFTNSSSDDNELFFSRLLQDLQENVTMELHQMTRQIQEDMVQYAATIPTILTNSNSSSSSHDEEYASSMVTASIQALAAEYKVLLQQQYDQSQQELQVSLQQQMQQTEGQYQERYLQLLQEQQAAAAQQNVAPTTTTHEQEAQQYRQDLALLQGEYNMLQKQYHRIENKYEIILKDYNTTLQIYLQEHLQLAVQVESGLTIDALHEEIRSIHENCTVSIQHWQHVLQEQNISCALTIQQLQLDYETWRTTLALQVQQLEEQVDAVQVSHIQEMNQVRQEHALLVQELQDTLYYEFNQSMHHITFVHNDTVVELEVRLTNALEELRETRHSLRESQMGYESISEQYNHSIQDAVYWEDQYQQRSYVNMTHITQDMLQYISQLRINMTLQFQQRVMVPMADQMQDLYHVHMVPILIQTNQFYEQYILLYTDPIYAWYRIHVHPQVIVLGRIVHPYYELYLVPYIDTVHHERIQAQNHITAWLQHSLEDMSMQYSIICSNVVQSLQSHEHPTSSHHYAILQYLAAVPSSHVILSRIQYSCVHATESIVIFFQIVFVLFLWMFHRTILRGVRSILWILVSMIWYLHPIRILFFRRRRGGTPAEGTTTTTTTNGPV
jgi:hypothetical protein